MARREAKFRSIAYTTYADGGASKLSYDAEAHNHLPIRELVEFAKSLGDRIIVFNQNHIPIAYINPSGRVHQLILPDRRIKELIRVAKELGKRSDYL